jgi:hypothetical protein
MLPICVSFTDALRQCARVTRRATLWRKLPDRRVALYHQGTQITDTAEG